MGVDILKAIIEDFISGFRQALADTLTDYIDYNIVYNCETALKNEVGINLTPILNVTFQFAFYLLTLKFVWKLFDIYLLAVDGDEDSSPIIILFNYIKALIICLGFGLLFNNFTKIAAEITGKLVGALQFSNYDLGGALDTLLAATLSTLKIVMVLIYLILCIVLVVMFIKKAIELEFLRLGISFATVGLLDSDGGVFKPYVKKFFQIAWTVVLQVLCYKLGVMAMCNDSIIWSLSFMIMAVTAPTFLQEFIMAGQGGKLQSALYTVSMFRMFKRG